MEDICYRCLEMHPESMDDCPHPVIELIEDLPAGVPKNPKLTPTKAYISRLVQCPINWEEIAPGYEIVSYMEDYWKYVATNCLHKGTGDWQSFYDGKFADDEDLFDNLEKVAGQTFYRFFSAVLLELEHDEEELRKELPQIEDWIRISKIVYGQRVHRFKNMRMADEVTYSKHFPPPNMPKDKIRALSAKGEKVSYFYSEVTTEKLQGLLWEVLGEWWERLLFIPKAKLYVNAGVIVGASVGEDTSYMLLDVDLSTPQTHAYPIRKQDIPNDEWVIHVSSLLNTQN